MIKLGALESIIELRKIRRKIPVMWFCRYAKFDLPEKVNTAVKEVIKILEKEKKTIYGYDSSDIVDFLGNVDYKDRRNSRYAKYVRMVLLKINISDDTAILFTEEKRHAYDMAEIAPATVIINGKEKDVYAIFIHEFSVATLKQVYRELAYFFPKFKEEDMEEFVIAFVRKVLGHELGHRKAWIEKGLFASKKDEKKRKLRDVDSGFTITHL